MSNVQLGWALQETNHAIITASATLAGARMMLEKGGAPFNLLTKLDDALKLIAEVSAKVYDYTEKPHA